MVKCFKFCKKNTWLHTSWESIHLLCQSKSDANHGASRAGLAVGEARHGGVRGAGTMEPSAPEVSSLTKDERLNGG